MHFLLIIIVIFKNVQENVESFFVNGTNKLVEEIPNVVVQYCLVDLNYIIKKWQKVRKCFFFDDN